MTTRAVHLVVNGQSARLNVEPRESLADAMRGQLGLTGVHLGCEHGVCGACTVLLNGEAVRSCLMLAVQADGERVTTIEGISPATGLSALQQSFREHHALQCGFCTPGMVLALHALLEHDPLASDEDIREAISGNLCRCTGYEPIVAAARAVVQSNRTRIGESTPDKDQHQ